LGLPAANLITNLLKTATLRKVDEPRLKLAAKPYQSIK
jgi:hypothetical protein